jgi:prepilin-type N-terminal cleavage/methylation domain-containing protein
MKSARDNRSAFTLIELMMVVAIMGICLAFGIPAISNMVHRAPLTQAVVDVTEACRKARAIAILRDQPMEMLIYSDGRIQVSAAQTAAVADANADGSVAPPPAKNTVLAAAAAEANPPPHPQSDGFSAQLSDTVAVELIDVNFVDYMGADVARVRFYPNGTSDEFTMVLKKDNERRKISLEVVTGLAQVEAL